MPAKIYSNFFANPAVAWAAGGIITPIFAGSSLNDLLIFVVIGIIGSFVCLKIAIMYLDDK
jgi:hypothetical protein